MKWRRPRSPATEPSAQPGPDTEPSDSARRTAPRGAKKPLGERPHFQIFYVLFALLGVFMLRDLWVSSQNVDRIPYSEFQTLLGEGQIAEVTVSGNTLEGRFKEPRDGKSHFATQRVDPELAAELAKHDVEFASSPQSNLLPTLLSWIVPIALFFAVWMFLLRRMAGNLGAGGGMLAIGRSKAKVYVESDTKVCFDDVAGVDEAKIELREVVAFLRDPTAYGRLGAHIPKGILLVGPPGTGKTLMARAVAGEAGVPFFSISGSEFVELFVGVGAARVRDLFEQARTHAPCIIFVDELDALGRARGAAGGFGGHDEKEQTLNQLLVELDGFDPTSGIVLLAATNRPEILDPALLRAGRFDRHVLLDRPDRAGRAAILGVHLPKIRSSPDVDAETIAALTPGFTGADLANLVNEAALVATRRSAEAVSMADFTAAVERIVAGLERKNRILNPREREFVAHHEMGHALVAAALPGSDVVHKVSIVARGIGALGYTIQRPTDDRYLMTRAELEGKLAVLLGGRAAEDLVFGELSTGAADDLARATEIARNMVSRFGMVPELGPVSYDEPVGSGGAADAVWPRPRRYSEATAREIDCALREIVNGAFQRARAILADHRAVLEESARDLLEHETLGEADLHKWFDRMGESA
jgi:cell division protease FtsH